MLLRTGVLLICAATAGCAKTSSEPDIQELIVTRPPTFDGLASKSYIFPGTLNTISGECDPISKAIEYSFDKTSWTTIAGGCPASVFSVVVTANPRKRVYVRAKTKTGYTAYAAALVQLALPPTSPEVAAVVSSRSDQDGEFGATNTLTYIFTGDSSQSASHNAHFNVIGTTYGE